MNLFNFLKKRKQHSFEELLKKAADEPAYRAEFIKRILTEKLAVITKGPSGPEGYSIAQKDTLINIFTFPDGRIPIFTSVDRIFDKGIIKEQVNFLECKGEDLFNLVKGAKLIMNPYSDYGKEFSPEETQRLLNGTYFDDNVKQITFDKPTMVRIGQPAKYPTEIVKSLVKLFSVKPDVIAAYLGWIHDPSSNVPPHYIFAIEAKGDWGNVSQAAGFTAQQFLDPSEIIDIIQITGKGGFEDYFITSTKPFYTTSR
ncbi:MAG: enhanced serine sensitivity protein SseB C-terminal domain-containing protein [Sphingobacteriales bacterium]